MLKGPQLMWLEFTFESISALILIAFPGFAGRMLGAPADQAGIWPRYAGLLVAGLAAATLVEAMGWSDRGLGLAGHATINLVVAFGLVSMLVLGAIPNTWAKVCFGEIGRAHV